MKKAGESIRAIICLIIFCMCVHTYLGCGEAAAGESGKEPSIDAKIAALTEKIEAKTSQAEKEQQKLLNVYKVAKADLDIMKADAQQRIQIAVKRDFEVLHRDRVKRCEVRSKDDKAEIVVKGARFRQLGEENNTTIIEKKSVYQYVHEQRFQKLLQAYQAQYEAQEAKLKKQHDEEVAALKAERDKLESSWSYKWYKTKAWTGQQYSNACSWFGGDAEEPKAVAKAEN